MDGETLLQAADLRLMLDGEEIALTDPTTLSFRLLQEMPGEGTALLHYVDGEWVRMPMTPEGDRITFPVNTLGLFAVVKAGEGAA